METRTARAKERFSAALPYVWLVVAVGGLSLVSWQFGDDIVRRLNALEDAPTAPVLASIVLFAACGFASYYATWKTPLPSFVVAIALGVAGHALFAPIIHNDVMLASLVTASAAVILFGGGLEMPLRDFVRLLPKIALLAFPGVLITAFLLSSAAQGIGAALGAPLAPAVIVLLGAILASTDPAAIIPVLGQMRFRRRDAKDLVIAESALNDVVGALLTSAFLKLPLAGAALAGVYASLMSTATLGFLAMQTLSGVAFGLIGFVMLHLLSQMKRRHPEHFGADQIYFLATPIFAFVGAAAFGGSGFLAAFVAGLAFHAEEHLQQVERFFFQVVDGVAKPVVFVLVGALVDLRGLVAYAPVGIAAALVFLCLIRPAMVFATLGVFMLVRSPSQRLSARELLFVSFVRETGAIPAVLLVTAISRSPAPLHGLVEIGM
ncbi:MAG TPA: cation:proton antiporter, partial [Caulobacteraceae bacterium]|nr:cation:proton antiporter [Caulobacteraceae bacterium]